MSEYRDLRGVKFNRLTCLQVAGSTRTGRRKLWLCKCDCGNEVVIDAGSLVSGNTKSCGCYQKEVASRSCRRRTVHNACYTPGYKSWAHMKDRCTRPNCKSYPDYGGRGITLCDKWHTFTGFWEDMGPSYKPGLTIDRIDNNGNYEPANCRWATKVEQNNNKRSNVVVAYKGEQRTLAEWARAYNIPYKVLNSRLHSGWAVERAIETPVPEDGLGNVKLVTYQGQTKSIAQWSRVLGIGYKTLHGQLYRGKTIDQILNEIA